VIMDRSIIRYPSESNRYANRQTIGGTGLVSRAKAHRRENLAGQWQNFPP
jgi:hypothetical protein